MANQLLQVILDYNIFRCKILYDKLHPLGFAMKYYCQCPTVTTVLHLYLNVSRLQVSKCN